MLKPIFARLLLTCVCLMSACAPQPTSPPKSQHKLVVFAAASLTEVFTEIGAAFERENTETRVVFNFGGTPALRAQLQEGAVADVFASADQAQMQQALSATLVDAGAAQVFVRNGLVVVVPAANPAQINALPDLARAGVKLVLAAEAVPAGQYARQSIAKLGTQYGAAFQNNVLKNIASNENNVKQLLAKVRLGEADAGIVYTSDVSGAVAQELKTLEIPEPYNVLAEYPIAPLRTAPNPALAQTFVAFTLSSASQSILKKWGFTPVQP
jgi:molybdate transport system substrate-binding protein